MKQVWFLFCFGGFFFLFVFFFEGGQGARTGSCVTQTDLASNSLIENDLELQILLLPVPECSGCRLGAPCKFYVVLALGPRASCRLGKHTISPPASAQGCLYSFSFFPTLEMIETSGGCRDLGPLKDLSF